MEICNPLDHRVYLCCQGLLKSMEIVSKINRDIFVPGDKDRAFSKHSKASVIPKEQGTTKTDRALSTQRLHSHRPHFRTPRMRELDHMISGICSIVFIVLLQPALKMSSRLLLSAPVPDSNLHPRTHSQRMLEAAVGLGNETETCIRSFIHSLNRC